MRFIEANVHWSTSISPAKSISTIDVNINGQHQCSYLPKRTVLINRTFSETTIETSLQVQHQEIPYQVSSVVCHDVDQYLKKFVARKRWLVHTFTASKMNFYRDIHVSHLTMLTLPLPFSHIKEYGKHRNDTITLLCGHNEYRYNNRFSNPYNLISFENQNNCWHRLYEQYNTKHDVTFSRPV